MTEIKLVAGEDRTHHPHRAKRYMEAPYWDSTVHINKDGDMLVAEVHLPEIEPKKLHVFVEGDRLRIAGSRGHVRTVRKHDGPDDTCWFESFQECVPIPPDVETKKVRAVLRDGDLTVTMPRCRRVLSYPTRTRREFYEGEV